MLDKYEEKILQEVPSEDSTTREEKMILHDKILELKPEVIVEIGTHRGLTTLYMLCAVAQNGKGHLTTYDPYENWGARGNFRKFPELEQYVTYEVKPGKEMTEDKIDFLFVDGFHEKDYVVDEIRAFLPRLNDNAHVYFHDTAGSNDSCDVPGAIDAMKLNVTKIDTQNGMMLYIHNPKQVEVKTEEVKEVKPKKVSKPRSKANAKSKPKEE